MLCSVPDDYKPPEAGASQAQHVVEVKKTVRKCCDTFAVADVACRIESPVPSGTNRNRML